jgi:hypothetical protein
VKLLRELELTSMPSIHLGLKSASRVTGLRYGRVNHLLRDEVECGRLPAFHATDLAIFSEQRPAMGHVRCRLHLTYLPLPKSYPRILELVKIQLSVASIDEALEKGERIVEHPYGPAMVA